MIEEIANARVNLFCSQEHKHEHKHKHKKQNCSFVLVLMFMSSALLVKTYETNKWVRSSYVSAYAYVYVVAVFRLVLMIS